MDRDAVVAKLKAGQKKRSLRDYAKALGVTVAYLSDIYRGRRDPGPSILKPLGLEKLTVTTYEKQ